MQNLNLEKSMLTSFKKGRQSGSLMLCNLGLTVFPKEIVSFSQLDFGMEWY